MSQVSTDQNVALMFSRLRHAGDLGNILQSPQGLVSTQFSDMVISLEGINNVVGRSIVVSFVVIHSF